MNWPRNNTIHNHYKTYGYSSLMIFLGVDFWRKELPVYPLIEHLVKTGKYNGLRISLTDDINEVVQTVKTFKPEKEQQWVFFSMVSLKKSGYPSGTSLPDQVLLFFYPPRSSSPQLGTKATHFQARDCLDTAENAQYTQASCRWLCSPWWTIAIVRKRDSVSGLRKNRRRIVSLSNRSKLKKIEQISEFLLKIRSANQEASLGTYNFTK